MILIDQFINLNAGSLIVCPESGQSFTVLEVETVYDELLARQITYVLRLDDGSTIYVWNDAWRAAHLVDGQATLLAAIEQLVATATEIIKLLHDGGPAFAFWGAKIGALDKATFEVASLIQKGVD